METIPKMKSSFQAIAEAVPPEDLRADMAALGGAGLLAKQGPFDVYMAPAKAIPKVLLEIGRLREVTFRAAGVGIGKPRDLDDYDEFYTHLFLWDREHHQIAGGYRFARTDLVFAEFGFEGIYSGSYCECEQSLMDYLNPALELGRSWVSPEYQRSMHPLLGLWKGIGQFVARYPRYHKLFGAITISDDYTPISKNLIVRFLRRSKIDPSWGGGLQPLFPFQDQSEEFSAGFTSIEEVSAQVATLESDGKGVPVLLRQYLKLNATLLTCAYAPKFQNCLHALVLVDLKQAPGGLLKKYMGREGYEKFQGGRS
jgi:hypothetical protein